ncbi:MAG: ATP-binding protein [Gammaproteobacteria bacterium]
MSNAIVKVLIVDDSAADREIASRMLRPQFSVVEAPNVAQGLALFAQEKPDCVLLDHHMPGMDGLEALAEFVQARAVVIMVSAEDSEVLAAEAFKRGARDFIQKRNLTQSVLLRMIAREQERRRLELALQATQQRFDEVAARIAEVLWVCSLEGEFLYLSPSFEQIWGRPREGMTLALWGGSLHPDDQALNVKAMDLWAAAAEHNLEYRIVRPDGQTRRIRNHAYPIFENGTLARYGGIARDVTEENRLQLELRLAQKLEAIGQLAAGVAHEINTPAQYVSDNVTFLSEAFGDLLPVLKSVAGLRKTGQAATPAQVDELYNLAKAADLDYLVTELPTALQQTAAGVEQVKKIVKAMKEFSHPADDLKAIDLNHVIETTITVAKNEWKYVADVALDLAADLPAVACNPSEIQQVLLNLIVNAAHAISDVVGRDGKTKGEIRISTRADGADVVIAVADTGGGIPAAILDKIYDPFFTTKAVGKGTGQGLAIAHRIVRERHRGTIDCESKVGEGTRFTIRLPVTGPIEASAPIER